MTGHQKHSKVLDFGGGDGELCMRIERIYPDCEIVCYEPAPGMFSEAEEKLKYKPGITLTSNLQGLPTGSFDLILSLEVFEHLPDKELSEAVKARRSMAYSVMTESW